MRSIVVLVGFLTVSFANIFAQGNGSVAQGVKLVEEMQYSAAIQYFNQLPQSVEREYQIAKVYLYLGKSDSATIYFSKVVQLDPKNVYATISQGAIELQKKNNDAAGILFTKAAKQAKKNVSLIGEVALVNVIGTQKNFAFAQQAIDKGKEVNTRSAALSIANGDVEYAKGEYGNALSAYEWAVSYEPNNALAYRKMGVIQTFARDFKNALISLNKSIELDSTQIIVYKNLSDLQFLYGKYAESLGNYDKYLSKTTPNIDDKERYALLLFFNKRYADSSKEMDLVLLENPNSPVLYRIQGYNAFESGAFEKGAESMKKFFELQNPEKIILSDYTYYGKLNSKLKRDSLAIVYLKKASQIDSTKNEILEDLIAVYSRSHQHLNAIACYNQMVTNGMPRANGIFLIGKEYYFLGSYLKLKADSLNKSATPTLTPETLSAFKAADSCFTELTVLNPKYAGGFLWKARSLSYLDPESTTGLAKPSYESAATIMEVDPSKNKKVLIECYQYLAYFNFSCYEREYKLNPENAALCRKTSISFYEKILKLDPADARANEMTKQLKK